MNPNLLTKYFNGEVKISSASLKQQFNLVWRNSLSSIAKNLGVSDNAVRKWAKFYQIPVPPVGYWAKYYNGHLDACDKIKNDLFTSFGLI